MSCTGLTRRARTVALTALAVPALLTATALAAWSATGSGPARAAASTMPAGGAPTTAASVNGAGITVTWPAVSLSNGTAVAGYVVRRYDAATGTVQAIGPGCAGTVTTTSCTEAAVPAGSWVYTDTPVQASWTGSESPDSNTVTVATGGG